jgi:hypothetical protein
MNDELKNYRQYSPTAKNRLMNCKKNAIFPHNSNSIRHELAKCLGAIMIHRWGDVQFDTILKGKIKELSNYVEMLFNGWPENHCSFLTEAWRDEKRRIDLVNLATDDCLEFETSPIIKKPGSVTIYV